MPRPKLLKEQRVKRKKQRVTLSKPAWARWLILRELMKIESPSKIMDLLIDTWYKSKGIVERKTLQIKTVSDADLNYDADTDIETYDTETQHLVNGLPLQEVKTEVSHNGCLVETGNRYICESQNKHVNFLHTEKSELDLSNSLGNHNCVTSKCEVEDKDETNCEIKVEITKYCEGMYKQNSADQENDLHVTGNDMPSYEQGEKRLLESGKEHVNKKMKRTYIKRVDKNSTPWIKIKLEEHQDKYKLETMESFERKNRNSNVSEDLFSCLVCNHFKCASRNTFEDHIEQHMNKALECEKCQYVSYCMTNIRKHKKECGQIPKGQYVCDLCGVYLTKEQKKDHMGLVHDIAQWQCRYCSQLLISKKHRLQHMKDTHPELCQYCNTCKKSKWQLSKEDFEKHEGNCSLTQACEVCGQLISIGAFYSHMTEIHRNIRKYQCDQCSYASKCSQRLKTHLLTHAKIHPFKCDQCDFTCVQSNQLKSHLRTHTGEKPYKCTQCKYAAAWNVQLKQHITFHTVDTAVLCRTCDVLFKNERTLQMHVNKEH